MGTIFTVEESNLICVFTSESRKAAIEGINKSLPHLDDEEMIELSHRVLKKLESITDEEFSMLGLEAAE